MEPMKGLKQNLTKIISSTPDNAIDDVHRHYPSFSDIHKKLFFVISFYHAIMNERKKFGALGWNQDYQFSQIDCQISQYSAISMFKDLDQALQVGYAQEKEAYESMNEGAEFGNTRSTLISQHELDRRSRDSVDRVTASIKYIKYIISTLNYGGVMSNDQDQLIAKELLNTVINPKVIQKFRHTLTGLEHPPDYLRAYVVSDVRGTKDMQVAHVGLFPTVDRPEIFGIHFNAQPAQAEAQGLSILSQVLSFDQTKFSKLYELESLDLAMDETDQVKLKRYKAKLKDVTFYTPKAIGIQQMDSLFRISYKNSIAILMHQEVAKYNNLLSFIGRRVTALYKYLSGEMILDQDMEAEFFGIINDQTPTQWLSVSYPGSRVLPQYLHNLQRRIDYMSSIINPPHHVLEHEPPANGNFDLFRFWLPGLFDPGNFFVLILQQEARKRGLPLETMTYKFTATGLYDDLVDNEVKPADKIPIEKKLHKHPDAGGYYIYGMTIHGGAWNRKMKFMEDIPADKRSLGTPFPMNTTFEGISKFLQEKLTAEEEKKQNQKPNKGKVVEGAEDLEAASALQPVDLNTVDIVETLDIYDAKNNKYYLAPLYITGQRDMLPSETAVKGFVRHIPIRIDNVTTPGFWVKRNVALLCDQD